MAVTFLSSSKSRERTRRVPEQRARNGSGRLRVLIGTDTYPPDVNGAAYFTARLAHGLAGRDADVHVLCQSPDGPPGVDLCGGVTTHRLRSMPSLAHETLRLAVPAGTAGHVDRLLARLRPDVIHIQNHFVIGRMLLRAARRHAVPVVATNHFMPENLFNHLRVPAALHARVGALAWRDFTRVLAEVEHVTTPTRIAAQLLLDKGFVRPVEAVSCGIDLDRFRPAREEGADAAVRSRIRARFGLPDRPTAVFVGRLDEEKRIEDLISALPQVLVADAQLVLVGTGARRERLERLAADEGVADRVHFLGFVSGDELPLAYRVADVFAIAGIAELQSIATLEAMASGLPVVAADAMALPHLVQEGRNGYLYQPGNPEELAKYLTAILAAPEEAAAMGEASRAMAARHDHEASLTRFEQIYRDVARTGRRVR
ncbi:glycosyltransferase involved in cell wall biosynthesis [Spinactinospora alkalitolerans]|uniref:Glycosyltransferase involved in cell wall biosynthesis n=1 Tax=Spinactinospora alkalitolerans TaxID=687207 RepID=A0A852TN13_9ACTN|nr:glycosyltransferase [Spinactinospora alkalitolerans]NYE45328.1 glycosyltransferase involved in cell wall biosynthesis [Spinactinospora alkalitolerans]